MKGSRAEQAGARMAKAIIEMVHLMYQDKTALHFYDGLINKLKNEQFCRVKKTINKTDAAKSQSE